MSPDKIATRLIHPNHVELTLFIPANLFWFQGHFEQYPIFPGVAQLDFAIRSAAQSFDFRAAMSKIEVLKFKKPITPQLEILLSLEWDLAPRRLVFHYTCPEKLVEYSNGKVLL